MGVVLGRTRLQLRQHIAPLLGGYVSSASAQGTTTTLKDNTLSMGAASDNAQKGKWLDFTSGVNSGLVAQVTSSTVASNVTTHTFAPAVTQTESADTYILWPQWLPPTNFNRILDDAILHATGRFYKPVESFALHGDGYQARYDVPSTLNEIEQVYYRYSVEDVTIHLCDTVWTTDIDAAVTASLDTEDYKEGSGSLKLVVGAGASAGDILAAQSITSLDLSGYDYVEFWAKATSAQTAADLKLHLNAGAIADGSTSTEVLSLPALTAGVWTFCRIALANPQSDTAITYVGLELDQDDTMTCWLDGIRATKDNRNLWAPVPRHLWRIDEGNDDLILHRAAVSLIGSRLMRLQGGANPSLFSADTSTTEVPERYIIAYAVYHALLMCRDDKLRQDLPVRKQELERAESSFPFLENVRVV